MIGKSKNPYESTTFGNTLLLRVDGAIGAMSLSPNGRDVVLAGRRGLFIIDLDDPFMTPRWLRHITSWEVADVQWSPHHFSKPSWCISTSNQKALLWDLARPSNNAILEVMHRHTRAITDINFHPSDPEVFATCSIDTFVYSWDMRTPRKPVAQWAEWRAGATQVKWNHEKPYEIASSHDSSFYIWDCRKGSLPVFKVTKAHQGKINGIDFSDGLSNIITCSNDKTIKFWNLKHNIEQRDFSGDFTYFADQNSNQTDITPTIVISTGFPVARTRNLPFGSEKSCGIIPLNGGGNSVHIVNYDTASTAASESGKTQHYELNPIYSFKGHQSPIKDFLWRTRHEKYKEFESKHKWKDYQLVTWSSQDFELKLWPHDEELYRSVNYNPSYHTILRAFNAGELDSDETERWKSKEEGKQSFSYDTYCIEPRITLDEFNKDNKDNLMSKVAYKIAEAQGGTGRATSQLNNLDWISNVRIGRSGDSSGINRAGAWNSVNPSNLSEEVSMLGHKFSKIRFEKIAVSTGELVMSLWGPISQVENEIEQDEESHSKSIDRKDLAAKPEKDNSTYAEKGAIDNKKSELLISTGQKSSSGIPLQTQTSPKANSKNIAMSNAPKKISSRSSESMGHLNMQQGDSEIAESSSVNNSISRIPDETSHEQKLVFMRIEVKFPKSYPFLEDFRNAQKLNDKRRTRVEKANLIKFKIEETYDLTSNIRDRMIDRLNEIAYFYANGNKKFCLEPCLRYLMGDKVDLDNISLEDSDQAQSSHDNEELEEEIGTEGWADDLLSQMLDNVAAEGISSDEEREELMDFMPNTEEKGFESKDFGTKENEASKKPVGYGYNQRLENKGSESVLIDSTPVPKGCGALWSQTGQLVCFFIPSSNDEGSKSIQDFNGLKFNNEGFSLSVHHHHHQNHQHQRQRQNLHQNQNQSYNDVQGHPRHFLAGALKRASNREDSDVDIDSISSQDSSVHKILGSDYGSDYTVDNDAYESSSSAESFDEYEDMFPEDSIARRRTPLGMHSSYGIGGRYVSNFGKFKRLGSSNYKSSVPGEVDNNSLRKKNAKFAHRSNVVAILNFNDLLPDKYELAREYRVLGDSPENLARYNCNVALKHGLTEIGDVWRILAEVLSNEFTLPRGLFDTRQGNSYLWNNIGPKRNRFYWGTHPFGGTWLIKEIVEYFEKRQNLQMLAMLSCILYENADNVKNNNNCTLNVPIHTPYKALPPQSNYSTLLDEQQIQSGIESPPMSLDFLRLPQSFRRDDRPFVGDHRLRLESSSSFGRRDLRKFVQNRRESSATSSVTSVRDSMVSRFNSTKKTIRAGNNLGDPQSIGSSKETLPLSSSNTPPHSSSSLASSRKQTSSHYNKKPATKGISRPSAKNTLISYELQNIADLDLYETSYDMLLLDTQDENRIKSYRTQYAEMLFSWGLPFNRIKILKFNYPEAKEVADSSFAVHKSNFGLRKTKALKYETRDGKTENTIGFSESNPWFSFRRKCKACTLCGLPVTKRFTICVACEHILHAHCAIEWWSSSSLKDPISNECPSGCGCACLYHNL